MLTIRSLWKDERGVSWPLNNLPEMRAEPLALMPYLKIIMLFLPALSFCESYSGTWHVKLSMDQQHGKLHINKK